MAINPQYMVAPSLEMYFVDKDTGLPLSGGVVNFFSDNNRTTPKVVYTISGSPPNYTYNVLGASLTLSGVGTFQDAGNNNVLPYYYPFDDEGNVDLYYIEVYDSEGNLQFTREAWPNFSEETPQSITEVPFNYIPNGQFLNHNNIQPNGNITQTNTIVAPGGWKYSISVGSSTLDNVQFFRYGSYVANPTASPRYAIQIRCTSPDVSDPTKYLAVYFNNVNLFSSSTQQYTFSFTASTYLSSNFDVTFTFIKNFGTGGSSQTQTFVQTFSLTSTMQLFQTTLIFGDNTGTAVGPNNDDYLALLINFPTNISFGCLMTDFCLFPGAITVDQFPQTTPSDFNTRTLSAPTADYNGYDYYLPLVNTPSGLIFDDSQVGMVFPLTTHVIPPSYLPCDGITSYPTHGFTQDGIPYARLQKKLLTTTTSNPGLSAYGLPLFGTGLSFVNTYIFVDEAQYMYFVTNAVGFQTLPSDGVVATGFNFYQTKEGKNNGYDFSSYPYGMVTTNNAYLWVVCNSVGIVSGQVGPGTTSFNINTSPDTTMGERLGTSITQQIISVDVTNFPSAGTYFYISNPTSQYYVWFTVDGVGSDPAPGGTGIQVNLLSVMDNSDVANIIAYSLSGYQTISLMINKTGSTITQNSYFTFYSSGQAYYVWYSLNGNGTDPMIGGAVGIAVNYTSGDTSEVLRDKTILSMNSMYFATPDLRGVTIKGWDNGALTDKNYIYRYATNWFSNPYYIGTSQFDMLLGHTHPLPIYLSTLASLSISTSVLSNYGQRVSDPESEFIIGLTGTEQNDIKNMYLNYIIKC